MAKGQSATLSGLGVAQKIEKKDLALDAQVGKHSNQSEK